MRARSRSAATALLLALALAACGDGGDDVGAEAAGDDQPGVEPSDDVADETADEGVGVAETDLGEILVDIDGRTLYVFEPDEQGESTCYDDCAENWPPLLAENPVAAEGADEGLVGTTTRDDETEQVTYDDWPLYHWVGDEARGDVSGQGVEGVWWVLNADGVPQRDTTVEDDAGGAGY